MFKNNQLKETLRISDEFPVNLFCCEIESNTVHWHPEFEILWLFEGNLHVQIEKKQYSFEENALVLINPNQIHQFKRQSGSNKALIVQIYPAFLEKWFPSIKDIQFDCLYLDGQKEEKKYRFLINLLKSMVKISVKPSNTYALELIILVQQFFLLLLKNKDYISIKIQEKLHSYENQQRLHRIKNYIDQNLDQRITLADLAEMEKLSPTYISHFFSENMGITLQTYIKTRRLEEAYHQLITTKQKIIDISLNCGFSNQQTFSCAFKEEYFISPIQVRKKQQTYPNLNSFLSLSTPGNNYYVIPIDILDKKYLRK